MLRLLPSLFHRTLSLRKLQRPYFSQFQVLYSSTSQPNMDLRSIVRKLEEIAPTRYAESWDNVGLLVEPRQTHLISRILLTNDLTEQVIEDAEKLPGDKIGLILSYHPPIFRPLKQITQDSAKERILLRAIQSGIAIYSPHTALDPMINDWLLAGLGDGETTSLGVGKIATKLSNIVQLCGVPAESVKGVCDSLKGAGNITVTSNSDRRSDISFVCGDNILAETLSKLNESFPHSNINVKSNEQYDVHLRGGKMLTLSQPAPLSQLVARVKQHLKLPHVRLATPHPNGEDPVIRTVSACAGSGGSVLSGVVSDLYLTGEMSHHDVLEACSRGTSVILCEHSNTERGFLQQNYKKLLGTVLGEHVEVVVAENDRDPLQTV